MAIKQYNIAREIQTVTVLPQILAKSKEKCI